MQIAAVVAGALKTVLAQGVSLVAALVSIPILISGLGPSAFGALTLCISALAAMNFANLGLGPVAARGVSRALSVEDLPSARRALSTSTVLLTVPAGLLSIALMLGSDWFAQMFTADAETRHAFQAMLSELALALPAALGVLHTRYVLEGCGAFGRAAIVRAITNISYYLVPALCVSFDLGPAFGLKVVTWVLLAVGAWALLSIRPALGGLVERFSIRELAARFREAAGFSAFSVSQLAVFYADRYVVGAFAGLAPAGIYVAVSDLATRINLIYGTFTQPLLPAFSSWLANGRTEEIGRTALLFSALVQRMLMMVTSIALLLSVPFFRVWLGEDSYATAAELFPWILFAFATVGLGSVNQRLLLAHRADMSMALAYLVLAMIFLPLLLLSVVAFGAQGAGPAVAFRGVLELAFLMRIGGPFAPSSARQGVSFVAWSGAASLMLIHGIMVLGLHMDFTVTGGLLAVAVALGAVLCVSQLGPQEIPSWRELYEAFIQRRWA